MNAAMTHPLGQVLLADGPDAAQADELHLFGQFAGAWDLEVSWFADGRLTRAARGEWHFGWVLQGRAMQDVWIVPGREALAGGAELYEYGTSIRFYDPGLGAWRSTWIGPVQGSVRPFTARARGDEIVLEGQQLDGREIEWVFSNIREESFDWRFQRRTRQGEGWEIVQAFRCHRRG